jgi:hypothetical protein
MNLQTETSILKNRLIKNLGSLNKSDIQNVLNFSEFLLFKGDKKRPVRSTVLDPKKDPILEIIGIADVEPFADSIDQQLYGV